MSYLVRNLLGDWSNWLPPFEPQSSRTPASDSLGCVSFSATHSCEIQEYFLTGVLPDYSERALAKLDNTNTLGNTVNNVVNAIRTYGLIPQSLWPDLDSFDWSTFYAPIPQSIVNTGLDFLQKFDVQQIYIPESDIEQALKQAPIWLEIGYPSTTHFVVQFNNHQYFDTYQPSIKEVGTYPTINRFQLVLIPKQGAKPMYQLVVRADGRTFGVLVRTPNGDQIIYATDEQQYRSWNKVDSYALPTVNADGSTNWTPSNVIHLSW